MAEETKEELVLLAKDNIVQAVEFLKEQAPEVAEQIILWARIKPLLGVMLSLLIAFLIFRIFKILIPIANKHLEESRIDDSMPRDFLWIGSIVGYICCLVGILVNGYWFCYAIFAPKLILLEYIGKLL